MAESRDDAPTTPPVAIRPERVTEPVSGLRADGPGASDAVRDTDLSLHELSAGTDPDTLMSLPKPTPHGELPYETRLRQLEDRLETLETRLGQVEHTRALGEGPRSTPWWFWLLFLVGLAVTWRVLGLLR